MIRIHFFAGDFVKIQLFEGMTPVWVVVQEYHSKSATFVGDIVDIDPLILDCLFATRKYKHHIPVKVLPTERYPIEFKYQDIVIRY